MNRRMRGRLLGALALFPSILAAQTALEAGSGRTLSLTGDLAARQQVRIYARVAGPVKKFHAREGQLVLAGSLMAEIDPAEYELEVAEARAEVDKLEARLAAMEAGGRPAERERAAAELASAEAVVRDAEANHERVASLLARGGISRQAMDTAQRELEVARARAAAAKESLVLVKEGPRSEEKREVRAELRKVTAQLAQAQLRLSYTKVAAPFDGVVGLRMVDEGAYVLAANSPQAPALFSFADSRVLKALVDLPETDLLWIRIGTPAAIRVQSSPQRTFEGRVVNLYPFVDPKTRTAKVEIEVPNTSGSLMPGMFVKAEVPAASAPAASIAEILGVDLTRVPPVGEPPGPEARAKAQGALAP
jgi:multidrug resistance efflux pump